MPTEDSSPSTPCHDLLRVQADDPDYLRQAAAERTFWQNAHPLGLESIEQKQAEGPVDRYMNRRFSGEAGTAWYETIARRGRFRRGAMLGTSSLLREAGILFSNPALHMTFFDIAEGPLLRRKELLGKRFPGRVEVRTADLNFLELESDAFDLIVSSSTVHHITNLEHFAARVNAALTADGHFFLEDYVGESRFTFAPNKKHVYEELYNRDLARRGCTPTGLTWLDTADLSPFCGVRSHDILPVLRNHLREVEVRTAGALTILLLRSRPSEDQAHSPWRGDDWVLRQPRWKLLLDAARQRYLGHRLRSHQSLLPEEFLEELFVVGDVLADCGLIEPGIAFATYRKRR